MAGTDRQALLKRLPKMDLLLGRSEVEALVRPHGRDRVAEALRGMLEGLRARLLGPGGGEEMLERWEAGFVAELSARLETDLASSLRPVINATGVVLHTNLGRSPLSEEAIARIAEAARCYTTLEYDLAKGSRGSRSVHAQRLLSRLFPGAAGHVVNNNAAAVLLALNTLAEGKEVIVSRGELVEIGGSFRIPDVMRKAQAVLREVGTTNRTRLSDYEEAITPETGLLLKVHTSNYRIVGFTTQVPIADLAGLGKRRGIPVMADQGSGNLVDLAGRGVEDEPGVHDLLKAGADVVSFSGDKLLGGPQAGILVGRPDLVEKMRRNPLTRALRVDKLTYAALEATLAAHVTGRSGEEIPALRMIAEEAEALERRARRVGKAIEAVGQGRIRTEVLPGSSVIGGGAAPTAEIPTRLLWVSLPGRSPDALEAALRAGSPPVIARIAEDRLVLDLRTVLPDQEEELVRAVATLAAAPPDPPH
jgi:L-seryl-tRNA(Ser) seleniumtransferase